ncbi:MAG: IS110 family transposase [Bryobacteraceae bacterium]
MKLLYRRCAGLDIHKKSVSVCVRRRVSGKPEVEIEEAVFGTFTQDLVHLREWLRERKVREVAMESTGVYWIPVWNVLEAGKHPLHLTLVNPAVVRALQGRKTDRIDARRIAEYMQYGLLRGSFIPPRPIRQLRELTRMRVHVQQDRNRVINRIGRLLETVNIKLSSVASHIAGKSGRAMLAALARGVRRPEVLAEKALGHLRGKIPDLILALDGRPDPHFQWMLTDLLRKLEWLDAELAKLDARLCEQMAEHAELIELLSTIPGVERTTARVLIAELGIDMTQFATPAHLASWAGLCPGNAESAGKRFSGKTRKGDRYLRRILVQSAWAAARTKDCFLAGLFYRIAARRGMKKAAVAVAHRILAIAWKIIRDGVPYQEQGRDAFDRRNPLRTARKLARRLENIGFRVQLTPSPAAEAPSPPPIVSPDVCARCAQWKLSNCIHLIKRPKRRKTNVAPAESVG